MAVSCPVCGGVDKSEELELDDGVYVFCCPRCATGVIRTFAAHEEDDRRERRHARV